MSDAASAFGRAVIPSRTAPQIALLRFCEVAFGSVRMSASWMRSRSIGCGRPVACWSCCRGATTACSRSTSVTWSQPSALKIIEVSCGLRVRPRTRHTATATAALSGASSLRLVIPIRTLTFCAVA